MGFQPHSDRFSVQWKKAHPKTIHQRTISSLHRQESKQLPSTLLLEHTRKQPTSRSYPFSNTQPAPQLPQPQIPTPLSPHQLSVQTLQHPHAQSSHSLPHNMPTPSIKKLQRNNVWEAYRNADPELETFIKTQTTSTAARIMTGLPPINSSKAMSTMLEVGQDMLCKLFDVQ